MSILDFLGWKKPKTITPTTYSGGLGFASAGEVAEPAVLPGLELAAGMPDWVLESTSIPYPLPLVEPAAEPPPPISPKTLQHLGGYLEGRFEVSVGALRLFQVLSNPESSAKEIADAAGADPMLASRILKLVNSAAFGLPKEVTSLGRAIVLLGYNNVKALASQNLIKRRKSKPQDPARLRKLWVHASMVSACAASLARQKPGMDAAEMASLGLLHDMGKILLSPEEAQTIATQTGLSRPVVEAISGAGFAESCGLPSVLSHSIQAFAWLGQYDSAHALQEVRKHASILYFANHACNWYGFHDEDEPAFPSQGVLDQVGWDGASACWIDAKTARDMEKSRIIIEGFLALQ